jgi:hypothetical protein
MFTSIDVWKQIDERTAVRYRCFRSLVTGKYSVQSTDFYRLPFDATQVVSLDQQYVELFVEQQPDARSGSFDTIEQAIAAHDNDFAC